MKLSILIVNFNTCQLLRQSLTSLVNAAKKIDYEIVIIDSASSDGSVQMLEKEFPQVKLIANSVNNGFTKAANQGLAIAQGEYIFLVNADTITSSDALEKATAFMNTHPFAGAVSLRRISPMGSFMPESKRGLTKPWIKFFRVTGLTRFFPKSRLLNRKHADWTEEFETSEVDVVNGACMLLRRSALNKTGLFDERFFSYGADIDLSYRVRHAGYKNYYFSKSYIIDFNLQPGGKFTWDNIKHFYGAMFIFAAKYLFKLPVLNVKGIGGMYPPAYEID